MRAEETRPERTCSQEGSWFVCQVNPREEKRAKFFLELKTFKVYLPMMEAQRAIGATRIFVQRPLFPSYLFVRLNAEKEVPFVRWTKGVRNLLPESLHPVAVDDPVVESIQALGQRDGIIRRQPLRRSDKVRILSGPFKELLGVFDEWSSDQGRVRILLSLVTYQARVELHHSLVEKVA